MDALALFLVERGAFPRGAFQHAFGEVQACDALARLRERHGDPSGAATQLEHRIAEFARGVAIERHVLRALAHDRRFVVIVRDERIVQRGRHVFFVGRQGAFLG